jgi:hypothetical protein
LPAINIGGHGSRPSPGRHRLNVPHYPMQICVFLRDALDGLFRRNSCLA